MGVNVLHMKQSNVHTVLWALYSCGYSTVKDLAHMTGLSFATVGSILNGLVKNGQVTLGEQVSATGGRPSQTYAFCAEHAHVLAVSGRIRNEKDILNAYVGNLYGDIVWQTEQYFEDIDVASFEHLIDVCLKAYPNIRALAFSLPGVENDGLILSNNYKKLEGVFFTRHFEKKYCLPVITQNDVNAAVFGYSRNMEPDRIIAGIFIPGYSAPGVGLKINGKVIKGARGYAGEASLLPLQIDWLTIDYQNPPEIGAAVAKLLSIYCSVVNPSHMVLYGDFFTQAVQDAIEREIPDGLREVYPSVEYKNDYESDVVSGLVTQAIAAYRDSMCALGLI